MCTVFGAIALTPGNPEELVRYAHGGLADLQHRGHEWVGVAHSSPTVLKVEKRPGLIASIFEDPAFVTDLLQDSPRMILAHTRFSTTGSSTSLNAQPHYVRDRRGTVALASNGDIFDYDAERTRLTQFGSRLVSGNDGEVLLHHILRACNDDRARIQEGIAHLMTDVRASYAAWIATNEEVYLFRDPHANRPLFYLRLPGYFLFASEDCALQGILLQRAEEGYRDGTVEVNHVLPGEAIHVRLDGAVRHLQLVPPAPPAHCAFERIYFARPDSHVFGAKLSRLCYRLAVVQDGGGYTLEMLDTGVEEVGAFRYRLGKRLALEHPADADFVTPVPDSGNLAAVGYGEQSGIPRRIVLVRNPYVARTFISPGRANRESLTRRKYRPMKTIFRSRPRVCVVDDSVVFGTSAKALVEMLRTAGAKEVHFRVSCPPIVRACRYGIDMESKGPLIAADTDVESVRKFLGADTLGYLSLSGLQAVIGDPASDFCYACWLAEGWPI
jgi:amidophosphoribosyltransferase